METSYNTWKDAIKKGIKAGSPRYITKSKWYHVSVLSALKYKSIVQKNSYLNTLVNLIDERCQKININLKEVSSKDFIKLAEATRFIFLKQDFNKQTNFNTLKQSIINGKLDTDFEKYYYPFKYTKNVKTDSYELFRKSIDNKHKKKYSKSFDYTKELEDFHNNHNKQSSHRRSTKGKSVNRRSTKGKSVNRRGTKRKSFNRRSTKRKSVNRKI
jgi:hypothetical protein